MPIHNPSVIVGGKSIATGSYTGNNADDRQIATGFKCSMVIVFRDNFASGHRIAIPNETIDLTDGDTGETDLLIHATDGFVVDQIHMNYDPKVYYYWAISE